MLSVNGVKHDSDNPKTTAFPLISKFFETFVPYLFAWIVLKFAPTMSDQSANLRLASFSIRLGAVPSEFDIPSDILQIANNTIPNHSFRLEKEIVANADKENAVSAEAKRKADEEKRAKEEQTREKQAKEEKAVVVAAGLIAKEIKTEEQKPTATADEKKDDMVDESPLLDLNFDTPAAAAATTATTTAVASTTTPATAAVSAEPNLLDLPMETPVTTPDHDTLVTTMIGLTKQDRDVCYFYLECADWNLDSAVELLKSMQAISN